MKPFQWQRFLSILCEALGVTALVLAVLLGYATRSIFNSQAFANRVAASLTDPGVSTFVAGKIADGVIAAKPDLTGLRPLIITGGRSIVASPPFRMAARRAALEAHRTLMSGAGEKIILSVRDVGAILQAALAENPKLVAKIPPKISAHVAELDQLPAGQLAARVVRAAHRARLSVLLLLVAAFGLIAGGVMLAQDRRRTVLRVGITAAIAACALWGVSHAGGFVLVSLAEKPEMGALAAGLWRAFMGDLSLWALALGLSGLAVASAAASLTRRERGDAELLATVGRFAAWPEGPGQRFLRGVALLLLGVFAVLWPLAALYVTAIVAGALGAFLGLRECFAVALRSLPEPAAPVRDAEHGTFGAGRIVLASLLVVVIAGSLALWLSHGPSSTPASVAITACNGYPELCDRRLDQVVFPTAHNAMGGADNPEWLFPNQSKSIPAQLEDGVRAFMIDAHYGMPVGDKVKTLLEDETKAMAKYEAALGKEGMAAALRIRDRLVGGDESKRDVYMAHGFCELGATKLTDALEQIRDFLVANPAEVIVIDVQDEGVAPADIAKCFEKSGLLDFVYRGPAARPWPTLRQMVDSDQRVVVFAENDTTGVPWYHQAFATIQETPYTFHDPSEFSEKPNRGTASGSLLMMNHWIETTPMPKPSNAKLVNSYDFLLERARRCQKTRRHIVNFVAVDFYAEGDLMKVCATLNGVGPKTP